MDTLWAKLFIQVQNDFSVGLGAEAVSFFLQKRAQFTIVVDFTVEHNPHRLVFVSNRLPAASQVNNG